VNLDFNIYSDHSNTGSSGIGMVIFRTLFFVQKIEWYQPLENWTGKSGKTSLDSFTNKRDRMVITILKPGHSTSGQK
jgi:hypothetical protein